MATTTSAAPPAQQQPGTPQTTQQASTQLRPREEERALRPAVDIYEDDKGITLEAEMPGVSKDRLHIEADRNRLRIEGEAAMELPEGMQALYADVQSKRYARSFVLSGELDTEKIDASLKDGLLTLRIPKRTEFQPRKIEVKVT